MQGQRAIIAFLIKFVVVYVVLNTIYGGWIALYNPEPDPLTVIVTRQTVTLVSLVEEDVTMGSAVNSPNVPIQQSGKTVVSVFEGCNSINVMIVFITFVIAFTGTWKKTLLFVMAGIVIIYIFNLLRVGLLFFIARYYPDNLYFFHKYLFTGFLYAVVFFLWYVWIKRVWPESK